MNHDAGGRGAMTMGAARVPHRIAAMRRRIAFASFKRGNGWRGTGTSRNAHSGAHPSATSNTRSRSGGQVARTFSLCRSKTATAWSRSVNRPSKRPSHTSRSVISTQLRVGGTSRSSHRRERGAEPVDRRRRARPPLLRISDAQHDLRVGIVRREFLPDAADREVDARAEPGEQRRPSPPRRCGRTEATRRCGTDAGSPPPCGTSGRTRGPRGRASTTASRSGRSRRRSPASVIRSGP